MIIDLQAEAVMLDCCQDKQGGGAQCVTRLTMLIKKFSKVDYVCARCWSLSEIVRDQEDCAVGCIVAGQIVDTAGLL